MTKRKYKEFWTEVKRVVNGEVVETICCCKFPGESCRDCGLKSGHKNPCSCACHPRKRGPRAVKVSA